MKPTRKYKIEPREYTYTYRSYMACQEHGPDDCMGTGVEYVVFSNGKELRKKFIDKKSAKEYIKNLK